jgi:predicted RNA binding protein YcfA (HicA-like mRNA interferase family)
VKLPRGVSGRKAVKASKRLGFTVEHQRGSHIRLARNSLRITIPNHPELAPETLQSILRQAGVSLEDFVDAL